MPSHRKTCPKDLHVLDFLIDRTVAPAYSAFWNMGITSFFSGAPTSLAHLLMAPRLTSKDQRLRQEHVHVSLDTSHMDERATFLLLFDYLQLGIRVLGW